MKFFALILISAPLIHASSIMCPPGSFVTQVFGRRGSNLDAIQLACSDGSTTDSIGGDGGAAFALPVSTTGFASIQLSMLDGWLNNVIINNKSSSSVLNGTITTYSGCLMIGGDYITALWPYTNTYVVQSFNPSFECVQVNFNCSGNSFVDGISIGYGTNIINSIILSCSDGSISQTPVNPSSSQFFSAEYLYGLFEITGFYDSIGQLSGMGIDGFIFGSVDTVSTGIPYRSNDYCRISGASYFQGFINESVFGLVSIQFRFSCNLESFICNNGSYVTGLDIAVEPYLDLLAINCSDGNQTFLFSSNVSGSILQIYAPAGMEAVQIVTSDTYVDAIIYNSALLGTFSVGDTVRDYASNSYLCPIIGFNYSIIGKLESPTSLFYPALGTFVPIFECTKQPIYSSYSSASLFTTSVTISPILAYSTDSSVISMNDAPNSFLSTSQQDSTVIMNSNSKSNHSILSSVSNTSLIALFVGSIAILVTGLIVVWLCIGRGTCCFKSSSRNENTKSNEVTDTVFSNDDSKEGMKTALSFYTNETVAGDSILAIPAFLQLQPGIDVRWSHKIADGGEAVIYSADAIAPHIIIKDGRQLVAKLVKRDDNMNAFYQELAIMHRLSSHDYIVKLVGYCENPLAIFCKFYNSGTLETVRQNLKLTKSLFFSLMKVLKAVEYMHDCKIAHCDIKPSNILVDWDQEQQMFKPALNDFGISKILDSSIVISQLKIANVRGLSTGYAAPEMLMFWKTRNWPPDLLKKSDIFSCGGLIYFLLTSWSPRKGFRKKF